MSGNKVDKVKKSKLFRVWDILVYVLLLAIILVLLWAFIWRVPKGDLSDIEILIKDNVVASYDFKKDDLLLYSDNIEYTKTNNIYTLKVYIDNEKQHFNEVKIDKEKKQVYVSDANCSKSKDCVKMKEITKSGDNIICVPHQLIIRAKGDNEIKDPISG